MKLKIGVPDNFGQFLERAVMNSSNVRITAARSAINDISYQAYAKANEMASDRLHSTRQKYIDNLKFEQVDASHFTITLGEEALKLEEGYPSFSMIEAGLARGPKSKVSKKGFRYVSVPFEHSTAPGKSGHPLNKVPVQRGQVMETTKGNMARDLKRLMQVFGAQGTLNHPSGSPVTGKAWSITKGDQGPQWTFKDALGNQQTTNVEGIHPNLSGVTKVQFKGSGVKTRSAYMSWRTASENPASKSKWLHPGFSGAKVFPDLEKWVSDTFAQRMQELFGSGSFGSER